MTNPGKASTLTTTAYDTRPRLSRQGYRCSDCNRPFQQFMGVNRPMDEYIDQMMRLRCPYCDGKKLTMGEGRSLSEDRALRHFSDGSIELRAGLWLAEGEVGTSSKTIAWFMLGTLDSTREIGAPHDLADLRRCMLLLDRIPEWQGRMPAMNSQPGWTRLADGWEQLSASFLDECPDLSGPAPQTGALLASLLEH